MYVNDEEVPVDTVLKNKDRVKIITSTTSSFLDRKKDWEQIVVTTLAKRKIREYLKKQSVK